MPDIRDVFTLYTQLSPQEQKKLYTMISFQVSTDNDFEQFVKEERFTSGFVCPHCGCVGHISRNGHIYKTDKDRNKTLDKQRYVCKDCGKSFTVLSNSVASGTRKNLSIWESFAKCMMNGFSVRKSASICGIHRNTAFAWRHKLLDALQQLAESSRLDGIIEADETFFRVSYKGNYTKSPFELPRKARKRGGSAHKRGLSTEQVCVPCAIDRKGHSYSKIASLGRIATKNLHAVFDGKICPESTLCTDKMNAYVRFAKSNDIQLIQLKSGKEKKGIYNIQKINNFHSKLKKFMGKFNGVSTKYLNNYLIWHTWFDMKGHTQLEKADLFLVKAVANAISVHFRQLSMRPTIPIS
jgi:Transposase and inactivated derivatives